MSFSRVDSWIEKKTGASDYRALKEYQLMRVRRAVEYVMERCPFYRERLSGVNCGFKDISELPFTYPWDIERFSPEMLCVGQGMVNRVVTHKTSGTTALPKRVFFTGNDQNATIDFFHHGMSEFTSEGDTVLILFPGEKEGSIGRLLSEGLGRLGAVPVVYGIVSDFDYLLRYLSDSKINVIAGLPQQILELSRLCRDSAVRVRGLHSVLLSADYAAESLINSIEENLYCVVYEHYGMTEMCFGGGVYSKERYGFHLRHNDFLFEIVDPFDGGAVTHGEYGEVVFTSLNTEAMPLIRYRTGDLARFVPHIVKYPVLDKIKGRLKDGVMLSNGLTLKMTALEEAVFANKDVLDFEAVYGEDTLKLFVRSLCFDAGAIIDAVRNSPMERVLKQSEIRVFPVEVRSVCKNTMNKRAIGV